METSPELWKTMSVIAVNVVQVVMVYDSGGELCENVYYVHKATPWTAAEISDLLTTFSTWETTTGSGERASQVSLVRITGTDLTSLTSPRVDIPLVAPIPGLDPSPVMPSNVTFALKANIGERGKGRNGRKFWIGLAESMCIGNVIDENKAGDIQSDLNVLIADVAAGPPVAALGVIHTRVNGVPITPATFSAIQAFSYTDLLLDSQRDRLPGHKRHKRPAP